MDINEFFRKEYLTVDEVRGLGVEGGVVTVLGSEWFEELHLQDKNLKVMFIKVQLKETKEIRPLRLGTKGYPSQACRDLRRLFGSNTDSWVGKSVRLFPVMYGKDKFTLGCKPYEQGGAL